MEHNWSYQEATYTGTLVFGPVTDEVTATAYSGTSIPLYIRDLPVATRKHKISEVNLLGVSQFDFDQNYSAAFYGAPEPLVLTISGYLLTPTATLNGARTWYISALNMYNISYGDLICAYIEGRMHRKINGQAHREDPLRFVDPYGKVYIRPKITVYEFSYTTIPKKQMFSMSLWLEEEVRPE